MRQHARLSRLVIIMIVIAGLTLVAVGVLEISVKRTVAQTEGNAVRGGLLYDQWWTVLAADEHAHEHEESAEGEDEEHEHEGEGPETDHPLWSTQETNTRSGGDTWRCKECHGWDYKGADGAYGSGSHFTGFVGVVGAADQSVEEVVAILSGETNPDHDFTSVLEEQDLVDLATFITESLIDPNELLNEDNTAAGDAASGESAFSRVCTHCHGPEGNAINFGTLDEPEFLGHVAGDNPWEFIHKVRYGQPGWPMPSAISNGWLDQNVADVLAYAETLPTEPALSGGGQLYDEWWVGLGLDAPTQDQPLWASQDSNTRSGADTWRCKECHGWDYLGADGAYGSGSHATGFVGVLDAAGMSPDEVQAWLNGEANADHDFSPYFDDAAMNAMVTFLTDETSDITAFVNDDGTVNGDPAHGRDLFNATCAICHGNDGRTHNFGSEEEPEYIGTVASENPWEFFHKGTFGQPGVPMPAGHALGYTQQDVADLIAYAQTLPTQ